MSRALFGVTLVAAMLAASAGSAMAAVDTNRVSRTIVGVGSDNTYEVMNDLDQLYNESPGCAVIPQAGNSFTNYQQRCINGGTLQYSTDYSNLIESENVYHDRVLEAYPVGSTNGRLVLTQFTLNGEGTALASDFSRASSKQTFSVGGYTPYGVAYGRDAMAYWVGSNNTQVATKKVKINGKKKKVADPNVSMADLKLVYLGNASGQCAVNWQKDKADSIAAKLGAPGSGSIKVFATQAGSGSGLEYLRKIDPSNTYSDATALQTCIPAQFKDGSGGDDRVIFENLATPICDSGGQDLRKQAIFPYGFGRFTQNRGNAVACAGVLGKVDGVVPDLTSIGKTTGTGQFALAGYRYNYFLIPSGVDVNDPNTWGTGNLRTVLEYLHPTLGWLCKTSHSVDPISGDNYRKKIVDSMKTNGFAPLAQGPVGGATFAGQSFCRDASVT
jgi:hypothetical protein